MNRIRMWCIIAMSVCILSARALSLDEARQMAHDNYPAIQQYQLIEQTRRYTIDNVAKGWLPSVSVSTGLYGFTDIVKSNTMTQQMGIDMKNIMINGSVTVSQKLYDGGKMAMQKQVIAAQSDVQARELDVSMYAIYERIDQLFFGILLLDEQLRLNDLYLTDLKTSEQTIKSMMKSGVANQSDLETILVEELKASQQGEALHTSRLSYLRILSVFIGKELSENETLEKPEGTLSMGHEAVNRPELSFYASKALLLDAQHKQLDSNLHPTVSAFGMGMIHSKVSDFLNESMFMVGVPLSWNIGALYTRKNDLQKLETQRAINNSQRETFLFQNRLENEEANGAIASLRKQITKDDEIVSLRASIRSKGEKKVKLGTESVNELVRLINAVNLAKQQKAIHEIELLNEMYKQRNLNNN